DGPTHQRPRQAAGDRLPETRRGDRTSRVRDIDGADERAGLVDEDARPRVSGYVMDRLDGGRNVDGPDGDRPLAAHGVSAARPRCDARDLLRPFRQPMAPGTRRA